MRSSFQRAELLKRLQEGIFDLVIIGGGITGAGIALDAASRGMTVALVEKDDFASGTSSRSTKLIHGGLRYLKQFEIGLVREVGQERAIVHKLAPHLVVAEKMLLPLIEGGTFGKLATSFGLKVYDFLAGVEGDDKRRMLSKEETLELEPLLKEDDLLGGGIYAEYRTDDARLTIEIIKKAESFGAACINYVRVEDFIYQDGQVRGVQCTDLESDQPLKIQSTYVVSAAGPWVDKLRNINKSMQGKRLFLSKGVHLVVPRHKLPLRQAVYFDVPDGRMIFAIPRHRVTYIGTTDTAYKGDINHVRTDLSDVDYLLTATNNMFPDNQLEPRDVVSSWAGLRPLIFEEGKSASELSRKDEIFESDSGLISIAGGKLTGYRKMSERIVDLVAKRFNENADREYLDCHTDEIELGGGPFKSGKEVMNYVGELENRATLLGLPDAVAIYLVSNYGRQSEQILDGMTEFDDSPLIALARAELKFTIEQELVLRPLDFFSRRTGRIYFNIDTIKPVMDVLLNDFSAYFNWDAERLNAEREILQKELYEAAHFEPAPLT